MPAMQVISFIIGSIVVIVGAYFATYMVARGSQKLYRGRLIQVLDRFSLTKDKSLALIAVYDKLYLVAFAAGNVTLLDNIDPKTAAALTADYLQTECKVKPPGDLAALILSRFRRPTPSQAAGPEPGLNVPYESYLSVEEKGRINPESFYTMLQKRWDKAKSRREDNN